MREKAAVNWLKQRDIIVPLHNELSPLQLVKDHARNTPLDSIVGEQIRCEAPSQQRLRVLKTPMFFSICLNRDVGPLQVPLQTEEQFFGKEYGLVATMCLNFNSAHYTGFARVRGNSWMRIDDLKESYECISQPILLDVPRDSETILWYCIVDEDVDEVPPETGLDVPSDSETDLWFGAVDEDMDTVAGVPPETARGLHVPSDSATDIRFGAVDEDTDNVAGEPSAKRLRCSVELCEKLVSRKGKCNSHYKSWRKKGVSKKKH